MRVACVGDSITHGVGLQANETYPAQLQRRLRADGRADAEVLNFGLNGASLASFCGVNDINFVFTASSRAAARLLSGVV